MEFTIKNNMLINWKKTEIIVNNQNKISFDVSFEAETENGKKTINVPAKTYFAKLFEDKLTDETLTYLMKAIDELMLGDSNGIISLGKDDEELGFMSEKSEFMRQRSKKLLLKRAEELKATANSSKRENNI